MGSSFNTLTSSRGYINMDYLHERGRKTVVFSATIILMAMTIHMLFAQSLITEEGLVQERYKVKPLYTITMGIDPTTIQIVADPRFSSEFYPMYELIYMSTNPKSEIRKLPELMNKLSIPESWQTQTNIVTDQTTISYPNKVGLLPDGSVGKQSRYVWWVASGFVGVRSGFLSNVGGIFLINMAGDRWTPIPIVNKTGKGFTHTEWLDMDIDGHSDCVTVEGSNSMNSLIWLRQPTSQSPWKQNTISGTDNVGGTEFRMMQLPSTSTGTVLNVFVVAGRTTGKLTAYWVEDPDNDWSREKKIRSEVIASDGAYVGIEIVDLNMDGRVEILTSTSTTAGRRGSVLAYEFPKDGFDAGGKWRKHILSEWTSSSVNFRTLTPGPAFSFTIQSGLAGRSQVKPHIMVSGADDGKIYVLSPETWSPFIWDYRREVIWSTDKRIGTPAVKDIDGNGEVEIFIPSDFSITVLSYVKSSAANMAMSKHLSYLLPELIRQIIMRILR